MSPLPVHVESFIFCCIMLYKLTQARAVSTWCSACIVADTMSPPQMLLVAPVCRWYVLEVVGMRRGIYYAE